MSFKGSRGWGGDELVLMYNPFVICETDVLAKVLPVFLPVLHCQEGDGFLGVFLVLA